MSCTCRSGLADRFELAHQRMGGIDLVVPIGADEQQVLHVGLGQQIFEQIERRRVQPLQSSRKSASGCSGRANTPMNRRKTI